MCARETLRAIRKARAESDVRAASAPAGGTVGQIARSVGGLPALLFLPRATEEPQMGKRWDIASGREVP